MKLSLTIGKVASGAITEKLTAIPLLVELTEAV
jgi:hypothetical protein